MRETQGSHRLFLRLFCAPHHYTFTHRLPGISKHRQDRDIPPNIQNAGAPEMDTFIYLSVFIATAVVANLQTISSLFG